MKRRYEPPEIVGDFQYFELGKRMSPEDVLDAHELALTEARRRLALEEIRRRLVPGSDSVN